MNSNVFKCISFLLFMVSCKQHEEKSNQPFFDSTFLTQNIIGGEFDLENRFNTNGVLTIDKGCSSVQISNKVILTAAHCIDKYKGSVQVDVQTDISVKANVYRHDKYIDLTHANDMALVVPIAYNQLNSTNNFLLPNDNEIPEELYLAGFGYADLLKTENPDKPKVLKIFKSKSYISEVSKQTIDDNMDGMNKDNIQLINKSISDGQLFCFKNIDRYGSSPYNGDSGGPLYSFNKDGKATVHGVFSFFVTDHEKIYFYCYETVFPKKSWILRILKINDLKESDKNTLIVRSNTSTRELKNKVIDGVDILNQRQILAEVIDAGTGLQQEIEKLVFIDKVLLIRRGLSSFNDKIEHIMEKGGAAGVIFYDNVEGELFRPNVDLTSLNLDIRFISMADGQYLLHKIQKERKVMVEMNIYGFKD